MHLVQSSTCRLVSKEQHKKIRLKRNQMMSYLSHFIGSAQLAVQEIALVPNDFNLCWHPAETTRLIQCQCQNIEIHRFGCYFDLMGRPRLIVTFRLLASDSDGAREIIFGIFLSLMVSHSRGEQIYSKLKPMENDRSTISSNSSSQH